jgi:hypothetical protein
MRKITYTECCAQMATLKIWMKQRFETLCIIIECTCSRMRSLLALLTEAVSSAPSITSVDIDMTDTTLLAVDSAAPAAHTRAADNVSPSSGADSPQLTVAIQAMTAAAERLALATARI